MKEAPTLKEVYSNTAHASNRLGDYDKALELHLELHKLGHAWGDHRLVNESCANLGNVRFNSGVDDHLTAELYQGALDGAVRDGDGTLAARCTANLASVYTRLGDIPEAGHPSGDLFLMRWQLFIVDARRGASGALGAGAPVGIILSGVNLVLAGIALPHHGHGAVGRDRG